MRNVIAAVGLTMLLAGCQTTGAGSGGAVSKPTIDDNQIGSGALAISQIVKAYKDVYYAGLNGPDYLLVSADGDHAATVQCQTGPGTCGPSQTVFRTALLLCQRHTSTQCFIHSIGKEQVWRGEVTEKQGNDVSKAFADLMKKRGADGNAKATVSVHGTTVTVTR